MYLEITLNHASSVDGKLLTCPIQSLSIVLRLTNVFMGMAYSKEANFDLAEAPKMHQVVEVCEHCPVLVLSAVIKL